MKNKVIDLIKLLIKEHEEAGCCTDYKEADEWTEHDTVVAFDKFYDLGRYETLINLLNDIKKIGE